MHSALARKARSAYVDRFGSEPDVLSYAPGRVEILGNHTDYNQGLSLSAAINKGILVAAGRRSDSCVQLHALDINDSAVFDIGDTSTSSLQPWTNYMRGLTTVLSGLKPLTTAYQAVFSGELPRGSGLASSAALTLAAAEALKALYTITLSSAETALLVQKAEQQYAGVQCGLLDPLSIVSAIEGQFMLIDFQSETVRHIPFPSELSLLICASHTTHTLAESNYNERREACLKVVERLRQAGEDVQSLRDVSLNMLNKHSPLLSPVLIKRASHIIGETQRVQHWAEVMSTGSLKEAADCLFASHQSSISYFENSSLEQNTIVESLRGKPGVYGARLTGAGFGGSVIAVTAAEQAESLARHVEDSYRNTFSSECRTLISRPSAGCHLLDPQEYRV